MLLALGSDISQRLQRQGKVKIRLRLMSCLAITAEKRQIAANTELVSCLKAA
jgi:hypothetical protein